MEGSCLTFQPVEYAKDVINGNPLMNFIRTNTGNMDGPLVAKTVSVNLIISVNLNCLLPWTAGHFRRKDLNAVIDARKPRSQKSFTNKPEVSLSARLFVKSVALLHTRSGRKTILSIARNGTPNIVIDC